MRLNGLILAFAAALAGMPAAAAVVDAVPGDHAQWSMVTGKMYRVSWDWSWAADTATQVKLVATGSQVTAEATLPKPATSFSLELPDVDGTAFDVTLTFTDGTAPVAPVMTAHLYAVAKFEDDVRVPAKDGAWAYRSNPLVPHDAAWTNATAGATLVARNAKSGAETNLTASAAWGALPLVRKDFGSDTWHLTLTYANGAAYEADVRFDNTGLMLVIR